MSNSSTGENLCFMESTRRWWTSQWEKCVYRNYECTCSDDKWFQTENIPRSSSMKQTSVEVASNIGGGKIFGLWMQASKVHQPSTLPPLQYRPAERKSNGGELPQTPTRPISSKKIKKNFSHNLPGIFFLHLKSRNR